jgi:hypothetical protein
MKYMIINTNRAFIPFTIFSAIIFLSSFSISFASDNLQGSGLRTSSYQDAPAKSQTVSENTVLQNARDPRSTGFKLLICDGPEKLRHFNPETNKIDENYSDPNFIACDFNGIVLQVKHLINIMIIVGTMAVLVGLIYAGLLYISGEKGKIEQAKKMLPTMGKGFVIMLGAWFIVYQILSWIASDSGIGASLKKILGG